MKVRVASLVLACAAPFLLYVGAVCVAIGTAINWHPEAAYEVTGYFNTGTDAPMTMQEAEQLDEQLLCFRMSMRAKDQPAQCGPHRPDSMAVDTALKFNLFVARPLIWLNLGDQLSSLVGYIQRKSLEKMEEEDGLAAVTAKR